MHKYFKYHTLDRYILACLVRNQIWVPKPGSFNDPFDCNATIFQAETPVFGTQYQRIGNRVISQNNFAGLSRTKLSSEQETRLNTMGVYCLTKLPSSSLMWGHYANKCTGFCLEYGFDDVQNKSVIEVKYRETPPGLNQTNDLDVLARDAAKFKNEVWEYEEEFRIVYPAGDRYYDRPAPITGVIFGPYMSVDDKNTLKHLLPETRIRVGSLNFEKVSVEIQDFEE